MSLANVVVIGAQWGDEGKGKITDLLSRSADVVVRYQGGVNAGHTIVVDHQVLKLHLIPSGILYPDTICLIGSGTVVDPKVMLAELDMLTGFGIGDRADEPMTNFSKGMLQKVSISSALLTAPKLLVLDEPLSGLDVETAATVKEVMREFAVRGGAVLYCSHILDVVQNVAHRIAVLHHGKLLACGTFAELRGQAGSPEGADLGKIGRAHV